MSRPDPRIVAGENSRDEAPVFAAPWHADAFAMAIALHDAGCFTWADWSAVLADELRRVRNADSDDGYYGAWLTALEKLVCGKRMISRSELDARKRAWDHAARSTPHGQPITLG